MPTIYFADNEETEKFIQLDKNKRALAHILLKRETSKTQEKLFKFRQENDSAQKEFEKKMLELRKDFMEEHENCKLKKSEKEDAENILTSKKSENENLREELENQLATIQKMEYEIKLMSFGPYSGFQLLIYFLGLLNLVGQFFHFFIVLGNSIFHSNNRISECCFIF